MDTHEKYMKLAIREAKKSAQEGEVPVGCVIVKDGEIIAKGRNRREGKKSALAHAEIEAIGRACKALGGWRLWQCELYVTLEPCPMCAGAIVNARIPRVFYGCPDPKGGAAGGVFNLFEMPKLFKPEAVGGIMESECSALLRDFFASLRRKAEEKE